MLTRRLDVMVSGVVLAVVFLGGCGCEKKDEEETPPGPSITVTSPDGGETWGESESRSITWTSSGTVGNVDIAYSDDGGTTWTDISTGETNDGSYTWTIPGGVDSANCLVRVQEADGDPTDTSDAVFTIAPISITVTSPDGGETWVEAEVHDVTWTSVGAVGNVDVAYSDDGGTTWTDISTGEANDGSYTWTIAAGINSNQCRVRVQEADGDPTDMSDANFTIVPVGAAAITVSSPNGGETWGEGESHDVTWSWAGAIGNVDIAYSDDGGTTWTDISTGEANDGSYTWTIPVGIGSANCLIRVQEPDGDPTDTSDAVFTIAQISITITAPNGGETWFEDEAQDITWTSVGAVGNVDIWYSDDAGLTWTDISTGEANDGSYTWTIPGGVDSANCLVLVQEADGDPTDFSDAVFTITPKSITIISPNGGEVWIEGEIHDITWTSVGPVGNLEIAYSADAGTTWTNIAVGEVDDGSYSWTLPTHVDSVQCIVRVREPDGDPFDISDAVFTIWNGIWKVDGDAAAGGDGRTWGTAFQHPEDAMAVAVAGDEVWVADGAYGLIAGVHVLALVPGTEVYGGFEGQSASTPELDRSDRDPVANVTVLDGNLGMVTADHVVIGASNCVLDGFTIQDGNADGVAPDDDGGGMHNDSVAGLIVSNCVFTANSASAEGGGMYNKDSDVTVSDCVFDGNSSASAFLNGGGGVACVGSSTYSISRTVFRNNTAAYRGGGLCCYSWLAVTNSVTNCVFYGNSAAGGGGMYASSGDRTITNCSFAGNTAVNEGGAFCLENWGGSAAVVNSVFWGDSATTGDEIWYNGPVAGLTISYTNFPQAGNYTDGGGNIETDPNYADVASGDLHLTNASRCIDSADNSPAPAQDIEGNSRYDDPGMPNTGAGDAAPDMGAYEFQGDTVLRVTSPNDGTEEWTAGTTPTITWYSTAAVANVHIELSRDGGAAWEDIVATTPAAAGSYSGWTATVPLSLDCLVRISDADSGDIPTDQSDNVFKIISGGRWYVDLAAGGLNNGTDWTNAFNEVQDAMAVALLGDEIWVAAGTYNRQGLDTVLLTMVTGVEVYGGFNSGDAWGDRDPATKTTILDGQSLVNHVVVGADGVTIDGFTVTNGDAAGADPDDNGGGMYNDSVTALTVSNCTFSGNQAGGAGAGMYNNDSEVTVCDCFFDGNQSHTTDWGEGGGGIAFDGASRVSVSRCIFGNNTADGLGGGLHSIAYGAGPARISNCVFYDNAATGLGMSGGGGISMVSGAASVVNCSFTGNSANFMGGGVYADTMGVGMTDVTVVNSAFWNNTDGMGPGDIGVMGPTNMTVRYSNVKPGMFMDGGGNISVDPRFLDAANGDLHLTNASHCIDAADGSAAPAQDIEGSARHDDPGMGNTGTGTPDYADMGAYEYGDTVLRVTSPNDGTEVWVLGDTPAITWYSTAAVTNVHIELSRDSGATWEDVVATTAAAAGTYSGWTVVGPASIECMMRISDADGGGIPADVSDNLFWIESNKTWYVDASAAGAGSGLTWGDAYNDIQDAMTSAELGDEIWVAAAAYYRQGADTVLLTMKQGVDVYGGFPVGGGAWATRDPAANVVTLDGDADGLPASGDEVLHVVTGASDCILDGFTIVGGDADAATPDNRGGGLFYSGCSGFSVANCVFRGNRADYNGGGIYGVSSDGVIADCEFDSNSTSTYSGGAMFLGWGTATVRDCLIHWNTSATSGAGIHFRTCDSVMERCVVRNNTAGDSAGGIYVYGSQVSVTNSEFFNNHADTAGAVYAYLGTSDLTMTNCTVAGNSETAAAGGEAGGVATTSTADVMLVNTIVYGNTSVSGQSDVHQSGTATITARYCDIGQDAGVDTFSDDGSGGTINADPAFVNAGAGDLHLDIGSPCIDAADGDAAPAQDIEGNGRYDNTVVGDTGTGTPTYVDMGVLERQVSP